jgi:hypothetical protein
LREEDDPARTETTKILRSYRKVWRGPPEAAGVAPIPQAALAQPEEEVF